jgi:Rieske Fe-S protein
MSTTITRRSAIVAASVAVVGGVVGFVWGRNSDATEAAKPGGGYTGYGGGGGGAKSGAAKQPITTLAKVPSGGGWIGNGVVITRDSGGTVHAFSSTCTHLGCTVNQVSRGKIFCPCHGSEFNADTGAVVQGPATTPLPKVAVKVQGGEVFPA